jgi:hypothetical protein
MRGAKADDHAARPTQPFALHDGLESGGGRSGEERLVGGEGSERRDERSVAHPTGGGQQVLSGVNGTCLQQLAKVVKGDPAAEGGEGEVDPSPRLRGGAGCGRGADLAEPKSQEGDKRGRSLLHERLYHALGFGRGRSWRDEASQKSRDAGRGGGLGSRLRGPAPRAAGAEKRCGLGERGIPVLGKGEERRAEGSLIQGGESVERLEPDRLVLLRVEREIEQRLDRLHDALPMEPSQGPGGGRASGRERSGERRSHGPRGAWLGKGGRHLEGANGHLVVVARHEPEHGGEAPCLTQSFEEVEAGQSAPRAGLDQELRQVRKRPRSEQGQAGDGRLPLRRDPALEQPEPFLYAPSRGW